mmetsp:Transcript_21525/g.31832  ORF Transcript_21525/g.31832 Transcript_21525/m.31832 type:complete len:329 (-) Transcript_21525:81-1067(-)
MEDCVVLVVFIHTRWDDFLAVVNYSPCISLPRLVRSHSRSLKKNTGLNHDLNTTNLEYESLNQDLQSTLNQYQQQNDYLNSTVLSLNNEVDDLEKIQKHLNQTIDEYETRTQALQMEVASLSDLSVDLNSTILDLDQQVDALEEQNAIYSKLNEDLGTVVSFLEDTSLSSEQTYEALASSLAEQILTRQRLLVEDKHIKYDTMLIHWDCDLDSTFRLRSFVKDDTTPITSAYYSGVIEYLEEQLLSELCIDTQDLETFLRNEVLGPNFELESIALVDLKSGVSEYTLELLNYYFPDEGEVGGLTGDDWSAASYNCANLPPEKLFVFQQ